MFRRKPGSEGTQRMIVNHQGKSSETAAVMAMAVTMPRNDNKELYSDALTENLINPMPSSLL